MFVRLCCAAWVEALQRADPPYKKSYQICEVPIVWDLIPDDNRPASLIRESVPNAPVDFDAFKTEQNPTSSALYLQDYSKACLHSFCFAERE